MINICYNSVCVCPFDCSLQLNGTIIYNPKRSRVGWVYEPVCVRECVLRVSALSRTLAPIYFVSYDVHSLFDESFIHQSLASINRDVYPLSLPTDRRHVFVDVHPGNHGVRPLSRHLLPDVQLCVDVPSYTHAGRWSVALVHGPRSAAGLHLQSAGDSARKRNTRLLGHLPGKSVTTG